MDYCGGEAAHGRDGESEEDSNSKPPAAAFREPAERIRPRDPDRYRAG